MFRYLLVLFLSVVSQVVMSATVDKIYPQWAVSNSTFSFTIEGSGFNQTTFDFGGVDCVNASRTYSSSTKITYRVTCNPSTPSKIALLRINHNGSQIASSSFQFFAGSPTVSDISVNGVLNAGNAVSFDITGSYLPKTLAFAFTDCHDPQASGGISSTQRTFTCTYWGTANQGIAEVKTDKQNNGGYVIEPKKTFSTNQTVQPPPVAQDNERPNITGLPLDFSLALGKSKALQGLATDNVGLSQAFIIVSDNDGRTIYSETKELNGSKSFDFSQFIFTPEAYGQKVGNYKISLNVKDTSRIIYQFVVAANVYKEVVNNPNQAKVDELNKTKAQISQSISEKSTTRNNATNQNNNNLIDLNNKKNVYNTAIEEQKKVNLAISEQTPSFDVIPNDAQVVPNGCLLGQGNKVSCLLSGEFDSLLKIHQSIYIEYNQVTNQTYPALIYGVGSYLDTPASCENEIVKPEAGNTTRCLIKERVPVNTPVYMVGNAKHLEYVYKHFQANKGLWAFRIDNKFQDELDSIAAARQESNFNLFNIDETREDFEDATSQTLSNMDITDAQLDAMYLIFADLATDVIPYVGNGKAVIESISGYGLITNEKLSTTDRVLNVAFIVIPQAKIALLPKKLKGTPLAGKGTEVLADILKHKTRGNRAEDFYAANPHKIPSLPKDVSKKLVKCSSTKKNRADDGDPTRFPDITCNDRKLLIEVKLGYASGTRIKQQMEKDIKIAKTDASVIVIWIAAKSGKNKPDGSPITSKDIGIDPKVKDLPAEKGVGNRFFFVEDPNYVDIIVP